METDVTCVFETSNGTIEVRVSPDDLAKLVNELVKKTHWVLTTIRIRN